MPPAYGELNHHRHITIANVTIVTIIIIANVTRSVSAVFEGPTTRTPIATCVVELWWLSHCLGSLPSLLLQCLRLPGYFMVCTMNFSLSLHICTLHKCILHICTNWERFESFSAPSTPLHNLGPDRFWSGSKNTKYWRGTKYKEIEHSWQSHMKRFSIFIKQMDPSTKVTHSNSQYGSFGIIPNPAKIVIQ